MLGSGTSVTSEDIVAAVQKLHAAFTDLAAKYQGLHQALAVQKASYRQLHRSLHGTAPVFETKEVLKKPTQAAPLPSLSGPSPFSAPTDPLVQARNSLLSRLNLINKFTFWVQSFNVSSIMFMFTLFRSQAGPPTLALGTAAPTATFGSLGAAAGSFGTPASASAFGAGTTTFSAGGFVNPSNTTFGAGSNSTTGGFGASTSFGGVFGASSTFGAASPIAGSKRNKH